MLLLTESEKEAIKRRIGDAFLSILKKATIRIILQKDPTIRSEIEIDRVINLLKSFEFFQNNKKLSYVDYRDLAQMMTYQEFDPGSTIYDFSEVADKFYVLLNGQVIEEIKNPNIDQWEWANSVFLALQDWKQSTFDPCAKKAYQDFKE